MMPTIIEHWQKLCVCMDAPVFWNNHLIVSTIGESCVDVHRPPSNHENDLRCSVCGRAWILTSTDKIEQQSDADDIC